MRLTWRYVGRAPVPAQPDSLGLGDQSSSGTEALMRI
jgi:hypothetical protein